MISISRIKRATSEFIKVIRFGNNDILTASPVQPANIDSTPIDKGIAIYADSSNNSEPIILGYINTENKSDKGEISIYSQNANGDRMIELKIKNNGTIELGGNVDNAMRFGVFNSVMSSYITALNTALATVFTAVGGTWVAVTADFSTVKIDNLKTS